MAKSIDYIPLKQPIGGDFLGAAQSISEEISSVARDAANWQRDRDSISFMNLSNDVFAFSNNFISELEKKADYRGAIDLLDREWGELISKADFGGVSSSAMASINDFIKTSYSKLRDKTVTVSSNLQRRDYNASVNNTLDNIKSNAFGMDVDLENAKKIGDYLISNKSWETDGEKNRQKNNWRRDLYFTAAKNMIEESPGEFINAGVSFFKDYLSVSDMLELRMMASSKEVYLSNIKKQKASDNIDYLLSIAGDHISSIKETGVGVDGTIVETLKDLGATKEAMEIYRNEKIARTIYKYKTEIGNIYDFNDRLALIEKKYRPTSGEIGFSKKNILYNELVKNILSEKSLFFRDPVKYVEEDVRRMANENDINEYTARKIILGRYGVQDIILSNSEREQVSKTVSNLHGDEKAIWLDNFLNELPEDDRFVALNNIELPPNEKFVYLLHSDNIARRNVVFNYLDSIDEKSVPADIKKIVATDLNKSMGNDDIVYDPINYFRKRALVTGRKEDVSSISCSVDIVKSVAYSMAINGDQNPVESAIDLLFGEYTSSRRNRRYIINDRVIGHSVDGVEDDYIVEYLERYLSELSTKGSLYSPEYIEAVKSNNGCWVQYPDGFYLFDATLRQPLKNFDDSLIKISAEDIFNAFSLKSKKIDEIISPI